MTTTTRRLTRPAAPRAKSTAAPLTDDWRARAACRTVDPNLFFPTGSPKQVAVQNADAKRICGWCPARTDCLDWAVDTGQVSGVWGGLSEDERRELMTIHGDAAWAVCLDRQELIERRRAEGASVRSLADELGVRYELFRKIVKYFEAEQSSLAAQDTVEGVEAA